MTTLTFGEAMLIARRRRGLKQGALAALAGVGQSYLCEIEMDRLRSDSPRRPLGSAKLRQRIMAALDMPEVFALCEDARKEAA